MNDDNDSKPDILELAKILDTEDMIGFTRAFVKDFQKGLEHVNLERFPWIEEIAKQKWSGIILSLIHI